MNPLELIKYGENEQEVNRFLQSLSANFEMYNAGAHTLNFNLDGGVDFMNSNYDGIYATIYCNFSNHRPIPGDVIHSSEKVLNINLQAFLMYNTTVGSEDSPWNFNDTDRLYNLSIMNAKLQHDSWSWASTWANEMLKMPASRKSTISILLDVTDVGFVAQQEVNWDDKVIGTLGAAFR
ncbi:hypothetical protein [Rhodohalobacter sp.]|uniref:hypothetical protein n=1 Tax=Rhodohalobacter sp. TaxID=1974210 RepID=UPI002ACDBD26|nr:hypothetical protein [Rhodohalobacter sp.]MDZ7756374.1 hypothetical protein [Rhodohalobacter sp.]